MLEKKEYMKEYRKKNKEKIRKKNLEYKRSIKGQIVKLYSGHKYRNEKKFNVSMNYTKKELEKWIISNEKFGALYTNWVESGYKKELTPSIDRIDDYKCYSLDNIQLMTWSENDKKGSDDIKKGKNLKKSKTVLQLNKNYEVIKEFHSTYAATIHGFNQSGVWQCCSGKIKHYKGFIWKYKEEVAL